MDIHADHFPVVIIGAGPTGLTLANLLGRYAVRLLLVEQNETTVQEPRAVSIDDESLRTMQAAGVIDELLADIVPGYGSIYYGAGGDEFARVEPTATPYGYPRRNAFRQPTLEARLRRALLESPRVTALFGWRLTALTQSANRVELKLENADGAIRRASCDYLVGCDGACSTVRNELRIELEGTTYAKRWLIVDLEQSENPTKHTEVFCDYRQPCITLPGPHRTRRYEFEIKEHQSEDDMLDSERIRALLLAHGASARAIVRRKAVYRFHARVAPRWQVGRVFLAGDAAHLTPPFAGQGMNSGIRDAHNLAWKLSAVLAGVSGPGLLESYQQERRDHVWQMIRLALAMGFVMSPPNAWSALLTQALFRVLNLAPAARDYITQMRYKPQPRFLEGFLLPDKRSARRSLVGRLVSQPHVMTADGRRSLLDEELGPRFVLLVRTNDPEAAFAALQQPIWRTLHIHRVAVVPTGTTPFRSSEGAVIAELDDTLAASLGADRDNVLLLRPDRYAAACFPLQEAESAARAVRALLASTWRESPTDLRPGVVPT